MPITEPFESALERFLKFLPEAGYSNNIKWVFHEDVAFHRRGYWIKAPLPASNADFAKKQYDIGLRRALGIKMVCLCKLGEKSGLGACSICYVFVPDDEEHSEYTLMGPDSLKFSAPALPLSPLARPARTTTDGLIWSYLRCMSLRPPSCFTLDDVPRRNRVALLDRSGEPDRCGV
ncbi:MAG: hypothetical protein MI923_21745 [Phycisphaerales bacterium]|nr:hypothetical protein [Phycisphaerales bacterium]